MAIGAALTVELTHSWVDWAALAATTLAAFGTIGAVIWAIYGPELRARRRRPLIELVNEEDGTEAIFEADDPEIYDGLFLRIKNAAGRETAKGVEVFLDVFTELPDSEDTDGRPLQIPLTTDENLNFAGNDGHYGQAEATVPANVGRRVFVARLGDPEMLFDSWYPVAEAKKPQSTVEMCGMWATVPARQDAITWLRSDAEYPITLTVAGQNFDAIQYRARVEATRVDLRGMDLLGMKNPISISFNWLEGPTRVS